MTKSSNTLLSLLFAICLLSPLTAQSQPAASWETFDELTASLRSEIDNLSSQITSISSDLTQSQAELQALKTRLAERETAYQKLEQSLTQSMQLAKSYESQLKSANLKLLISVIANIVLGFGVIALVLH